MNFRYTSFGRKLFAAITILIVDYASEAQLINLAYTKSAL